MTIDNRARSSQSSQVSRNTTNLFLGILTFLPVTLALPTKGIRVLELQTNRKLDAKWRQENLRKFAAYIT